MELKELENVSICITCDTIEQAELISLTFEKNNISNMAIYKEPYAEVYYVKKNTKRDKSFITHYDIFEKIFLPSNQPETK